MYNHSFILMALNTETIQQDLDILRDSGLTLLAEADGVYKAESESSYQLACDSREDLQTAISIKE
jgi:sulfur transfer complex TusBCD TusB component (DsrH family)